VWGSAWWLRYLFHLKLLIECVIRESSQTLESMFSKLGTICVPSTTRYCNCFSSCNDRFCVKRWCLFQQLHISKPTTCFELWHIFLFKNYVKKRLQYRHPIKHTFPKNVFVVLLNGPPKKCNTYYFLFDRTFRKEQRERERESLLQLWTRRTNLLKWTRSSHAPVPWKFVEDLFFNKGL